MASIRKIKRYRQMLQGLRVAFRRVRDIKFAVTSQQGPDGRVQVTLTVVGYTTVADSAPQPFAPKAQQWAGTA